MKQLPPAREVTYSATWTHQGLRPPTSVGIEVLNKATAVLQEVGAIVKGQASGYDVQANEYDLAVTVLTRLADDLHLEALDQRTGKTWKVLYEGALTE
jgi:hypothetical protein